MDTLPPKIITGALKRPTSIRKVYGPYSDASNPEAKVYIALAPLDPLEDKAAEARGNLLARKHIFGGFTWDEADGGDGSWHKEPIPLHAVGGKGITVTADILSIVARLELMQGNPLPENAYNYQELLEIAATMHDAWDEIINVYYRLMSGREGWSGKDSRVSSAGV